MTRNQNGLFQSWLIHGGYFSWPFIHHTVNNVYFTLPYNYGMSLIYSQQAFYTWSCMFWFITHSECSFFSEKLKWTSLNWDTYFRDISIPAATSEGEQLLILLLITVDMGLMQEAISKQISTYFGLYPWFVLMSLVSIDFWDTPMFCHFLLFSSVRGHFNFTLTKIRSNMLCSQCRHCLGHMI